MDGIRIPLPHLRSLHVCHDEEAGSGYEINKFVYLPKTLYICRYGYDIGI